MKSTGPGDRRHRQQGRQNCGRLLRRFLSYITKRNDRKPRELEQGRASSRETSEVSWEQVEIDLTLQDLKRAGALRQQLNVRAECQGIEILGGCLQTIDTGKCVE